jgi:hypothetical protein
MFSKTCVEMLMQFSLLTRKGNADVLDKYAKSTFSPPVLKLDCLELKQNKLVETVQEKAKCVASKNKQLIRRLEEHSQEIESLGSLNSSY